MSDTSQQFSSRLGLLLSVLGIAVGTGNIWRFPRIAAENAGDGGAGAFLIAWVVFLLIWSIPLIIAEYALGKKSRMGVVGTFVRFAGKGFAWMGAFVAFVATAIMFYYSVVAGWCLYYLIDSSTTALPTTVASATATWEGFQSGGVPVVFHILMIGFGALAVWKGVRSIERVNKILIPTLFCIVLISLVNALTLEGSRDGVAFLFTPDWPTLRNPSLWLGALTQNAWDTGAGWGLILTYGAYMQHRQRVVKNAVITGVGNNLVSIIAAITIFGTVFAVLGAQLTRAEVLEIMRDSGPASTGLTFIWMPQLFAQMAGGKILAALFFLGLAFAAFSSLISMIELATRILVDFGFERRKAIAIVCSAGLVLGLPSAIYLGFLGNQDFVWGVALMISGTFIAFAVVRYGVDRFRTEAVVGVPGDWRVGRIWMALLKYAVPIQAVVLLVWWLRLSATVYAPNTWFDPTSPYSVMTCLVQWGVALVALVLLNHRMAENTRLPPIS